MNKKIKLIIIIVIILVIVVIGVNAISNKNSVEADINATIKTGN